jgi:hypothetical protein
VHWQRHTYYNARDLSIKTVGERRKSGLLTLIIDGMDQETTRVPYLQVGQMA